MSNTWWALSGCGACCPKICCWNIFLLLFVTGAPMFTFLSKYVLGLALRGQNDKMRETHEAYQVPLLVGFHWSGYWCAIKTYCQEKYGIMLCYVLNPPTHLVHYELLPEAFFRPFFLFTLHCTQLTLGLKKQILYNGATKINNFGSLVSSNTYSPCFCPRSSWKLLGQRTGSWIRDSQDV